MPALVQQRATVRRRRPRGDALMPEAPRRTIFSLSSGQGKAGVAVIRISGEAADDALLALAGRLPPPRVATLVRLRSPSGESLDEALALRFAAGASFTGEATVELHVHGGRAVIHAVLDALGALPDLRPAEAGEFTRRALENGRLDLAQVEALGDLIDADTERRRRQALAGYGGALGRDVAHWRALLVEAKAIVAAAIDFSDEGDVGEDAAAGLGEVLDQLEQALESALDASAKGRIVSDGFRVAILGAPNAGKSTLLNRLAGSDVAIVTEHAGTTRDVLEVKLEIDGYAVILMDTAGLRDTDDPVERIGIARARQAAEAADLLLLLSDDGREGAFSPSAFDDQPSIRVRTKIDLAATAVPGSEVQLSALTGQGIDSLLQRIRDELARFDGGEAAVVVNKRQTLAIRAALEHIREAARTRQEIDFAAAHLEDADRALAGLVGVVGVENVLDAVFSRFCIGK
jgi:tRNA modification GTPase